MNKPILAAITGVSFGLFMGGLLFSQSTYRGCPRQATRTVETTHVVVQTVPARPPCHQAPADVDTDEKSVAEPDYSDVDATLSYAQTLFVNGEYEKAIVVAKRVDTRGQPSVRSARIQGAAACQLRNVQLADQAYRRLDAPGRQYLVYVCQRNGLSIHGRHFRVE